MLETKQELDIFEIRLQAKHVQADPQRVQELIDSIRENGLISSVAVTPEDHTLVAGFHRLEAFKELYKSDGDDYRHIPVRLVCNQDDRQIQRLNTHEKLFHPELSILEKADHFKSYFDQLKYGQEPHKTTTIFKSLDISRRTFFNLRAIAEHLDPGVQDKILSSSLKPLAYSTPQLLALCKFDAALQHQILDTMQKEAYSTVFEAIKHHNAQVESRPEPSRSMKKFLKSPTLKLEKELRQDLRELAKHSGQGQNELFNEIFEAGLEIIQQKYR